MGDSLSHLDDLLVKNECECFIRGSKHRETDESTRPQAECFYCFEVFGTPDIHEARVFDTTSLSRLKIQCNKACKNNLFPAGIVYS